jgi:ubiquinone/menaquinone biosynthesis C-methylase UbiE
MQTHAETVQRQFEPQAEVYLTSAVHAAGPDLEHAARLFENRPATCALDVGCGAGHLAFVMASRVRRVVASDPSAAMLEVVAAAARARALRIETTLAPAHALPFDADSFDLVATRYSAHHWLDVPASLVEMHRVMRPGGTLLVIDLLGEDQPLVDTHLQAMELLRDPSHVRNRGTVEWRALIGNSGFQIEAEARFRMRLDFDSWVHRMRTPPESVAEIVRMQRRAPSQVAQALSLEADGSFSVNTGLFVAGKPLSEP